MQDPPSQILVAENDLGVATLQIQRVEDHGNHVFTLRAFSASEQELASVRLTKGMIPDLSIWTPAGEDGDLGSEIVVSVAGTDMRVLTRETAMFDLDATKAPDPVITRFLGLAAVSSVLEREANVTIAQPPSDSEGRYNAPTFPCHSYNLNTSPIARQCCEQPKVNQTYEWTEFMNGTTLVLRKQNPYGLACAAANGTGYCSGSSCFWGPNTFAKPYLYPNTTPNAHIDHNAYGFCTATVGNPVPPVFPDVTGTFPAGAGCGPTGHVLGSGGAGGWDY